ncbi:MAG TPA: M28 family peptidase, partial [Flavobacterium sp.]
ANSLMYSIYKMLPNDTDLTVFREQGNIPGYNFAFIDDHFNYHTAQDDVAHLDHRSLAHQGTYLMPLLQHFSNVDLANLSSDVDYVYFSTPFGFISYPFSWIYPMIIVGAILFLFLVLIGIAKRNLSPQQIGRGFLNLILATVTCGILGFFAWKAMLIIYPQYVDILHGFTYNGHWYIFAFCFLALAICFFFYSRPSTALDVISQAVAPLFIWIVINIILAIYLPGAAFLIIPVFALLVMFGIFIFTQRTNILVNLILTIPTLLIVVPFIWMFPIGLGLKILFGSMILTVLTFALLLPVFGLFNRKAVLGALSLIVSIGFFIKAHIESDYAAGKAKPNSLVYFFDADSGKANWATYDVSVDPWTKNYLGDQPQDASQLNRLPMFSKYNSGFTFSSVAKATKLAAPTIIFLRDSIIGNQRHLKISITPNRIVNRYDIFAHPNLRIHNFKANGASAVNQKGSALQRRGPKVLSYYVVDNEPLLMSFSINKNAPLNFELLESSMDLISNKLLNVTKRPAHMMPKPFILNDAVILRKKIIPKPVVIKAVPPPTILLPITRPVPAIQTVTPNDTTSVEN